MKRIFLLMALLASLAMIAVAQTAAPAAPAPQAQRQTRAEIEQAVLQLEKDWVDALVKADTAKLEELYADTLVYTHSSAQVDDKAKYIANMKTGATKYVSIDREDIKANAYGNSAVVTCKATIKLKVSGEDRLVIARMIHVYVKIQQRWQMVAHQTTKLP